jgi:uncharacterized Fe-S cluster-containing protein
MGYSDQERKDITLTMVKLFRGLVERGQEEKLVEILRQVRDKNEH